MTGKQRFAAATLGTLAGVVAAAGVLAVTAAAFALSFDAIRYTAQAAHIRPALSWLFPVAVDGAMATAVVAAVVLRRLGRSAAYPWLVVLFGALVSVAANALHAWVEGGAVALPAVWAMTLSAVPPVLLALSIHLLVVLAVATLPAAAAPQSEQVEMPSGDGNDEMPGGGEGSGKLPEPSRPRKRQPARKSARQRVETLSAKMPSAPTSELAAKLKLSEATVRRYRPAPPDGILAANGQRHEGTPDLAEAVAS